MTTASGAREVPFARQLVWRALATVTPYCPVCDVSYVISGTTGTEGAGTVSAGTRFVCVPGRLEGAPPPRNAVTGEIIDWVPGQRIGTRLELTAEIWQIRIHVDDAGGDATRVTVTVTREPKGRTRLLHALQRRAMQRLVQHTVDAELAKLPDHIDRLTEDHDGSISVEQEAAGSVLYLRGVVDARGVDRLGLERHLEGLTVVAIDVHQLTYVDSTALPVLLRWAQRTAGAGRPANVRGVNPDFDRMLGVMGLASVFHRDG